MGPVITGLLGLIPGIVSNLFPSPEDEAKRADAQAQLITAIVSIQDSQLEVNKIEAASESWFVRSWRPAVAWVCVLGFAYTYVGCPILNYYLLLHGYPPLPPIDSEAISTMLMGMLGLGGYRTIEKLGNTRGSVVDKVLSRKR